MEVPQKVKEKAITRCNNPSNGSMFKGNVSVCQRDTCCFMFSCSTKLNNQERETLADVKFTSADAYIRKTQYKYMMEYYSVIKRMKSCHLEKTHFYEIKQSHKDKHVTIQLR